MPDDDVPNNLKVLWEGMNTNPLQISPERLRMEAEKLQKGLRRRSVGVRLVALLVIAGFGLLITHFHSALQRVGSALAILGGIDMFVTQLRGRPARVIPDMGQTECIRFYRAALERQRNFHGAGWFGWLLRLTLPAGVLTFCVGTALAAPAHATVIGLIAAVWLIMAARAVQLSRKLARMFQGRIDALDASLG
jgi:hypothetical protein